MSIADNIARVQDTIAAACVRANRPLSDVQLVAVSKTQSADTILQAVAAGLRHFGENRVEESETKIPSVHQQTDAALTWHMIGHIQSRKARLVAELFQVAHSVDNLKLATRLAGRATELGRTLDVLLEVNISGEESKQGLNAFQWAKNPVVRDTLWREVEAILGLSGLNVRGLMTMAPIVDNMEETRPVFSAMVELRAAWVETFQHPLPDLSMGMTDDYPVAIEEGATVIRVGRAIFGERMY